MRRTLAATLAVAAAPTWAVAGDGLTTYGDVGRYALPAAALVLALTEDEKYEYAGLKQLLLTSAVTLGTTYSLKYTVNATRPNGGKHSFPSGHAAAAFLGAAYITQRHGWEWGLPANVAAAAVAISRVDGDFHHWRDVIFAAGVAHLSAYFIVDRQGSSATIMPYAGRSGVGVMAALRF